MADENMLIEAHDDGSITFKPPFGKQEANYTTTPGEDGFPQNARCGSCAHFIPGGGCHVVQGFIQPTAVCGGFYADVGIFADNKIGQEPISMVLGDTSTWSRQDAMAFIAEAEQEVMGL